MEKFVKLQQSLDALFGRGTSKFLPKDLDIELSFAQTLLQSKTFKENCIEVNKDAAPFVMEGRSVFCKHVTWCGKNVRVSSDTPVLFDNQVIAVGKAILSAKMISDLNLGVAIKVRDSLKSRKEKIVV